jgi:site-specific recombinase XerD
MEHPLREFFSVNEAIGRSRQALEQRVERIRQRSGLLKPVYPHCLRATFATRIAEQGMSAPSLAYLMGWEGLQVAEAYIQSSMRRAHEEMRGLVLAT